MKPDLIELLVAFLLGGVLSAIVVSDVKDAQITKINLESTKAQAAVNEQARLRLEQAVARGDSLASELAKAESTIHQKNLEKSREIARVTAGRPCLGAAAVRLLNDAPSGTGHVPGTSGQPNAEGGPVATDTDVGQWIGNAQGQYEICRSRLDKLIDWWGKPGHD